MVTNDCYYDSRFFWGSVADFLAMNPLTLTGSIKDILDETFQRLSQKVIELICLFDLEYDPIDLTKLFNKQSKLLSRIY